MNEITVAYRSLLIFLLLFLSGNAKHSLREIKKNMHEVKKVKKEIVFVQKMCKSN